MADLMDNRRMIIASSPYLVQENASEPVISLSVPNLASFNVHYGVKQGGSGTPSVTNKRPISPWYSVSAYADGVEIYDKSLGSIAGGVYNIDYDGQTGIASGIYISQTISASSAISSYTTSGSSSIFWGYAGNVNIYNNPEVTIYSNMFNWTGYHYNYGTVPDWSFAGSSSYPNSFWVKVPTSVLSASSLAGAQQWVANNPIQIVAPKKTGAYSADIGSINVALARGLRTISTDPSVSHVTTFDVSYWTNEDLTNLYTAGDRTFERWVTIPIDLPIGTYRFSAVATSADTDASKCLVRFENGNESAATEDANLLTRSTNGESHSLTFHCTTTVTKVVLYASTNWPLGNGDTATFTKIRIERIG